MTEQHAADATRWQGYTHKDLYRLLHEGTGPAASAEPSRHWAEIAATLTEVGEDLRRAIGRTSSGWTGPAAGAAYDRLAELVNWAQRSGTSAGEMRTSVENQAEYLAQARAAMPVPEETPAVQPDPAAAPAMQVLATQQDLEPVEAAATAGQQRAFEVMAAYQSDTKANTSAMATFTPPADLVGIGDVSRQRGLGVQVTTSAVAVGVGLGTPPGPPPNQGQGQGQGKHWGDGRGGWTSGAAARLDVDLPRRPGPGSYTAAANPNGPAFTGPWGFPGGGGGGYSRGSGRTSTGTGGLGGGSSAIGTGSGSGAGTGTGTGTGGGLGSGGGAGSGTGTGTGHGNQRGVPLSGSSIGAGGIGPAGTGPGGLTSPDLQSAAASQMAAAAGTPAAAAPGAAAGAGTGLAGSGDKGVMRRFGADAIGSNQWFADTPETTTNEVRGSGPSRRRHDSYDDRVTEQVSIDGEQHNLPPTVIGE